MIIEILILILLAGLAFVIDRYLSNYEIFRKVFSFIKQGTFIDSLFFLFIKILPLFLLAVIVIRIFLLWKIP